MWSQMNKPMFTKILGLALAMVLCFSTLTIPAFAKTEADFEKEIERLEHQISSNQNQAEINDKNLKDKMDQIELQQQQLNLYNDKIAELSKQIYEKDKKIKSFQDEINDLTAKYKKNEEKQTKMQNDIQETYDLLGERMRSMYMAGETSTMEILFGATDFQDLLVRTELLYRVSKYDADMVEGLRQSIRDIEVIKKELEQSKIEVEEKQNAIIKERDAIAVVRSKEQSTRNVLNSKQNHLQSEANKLHAYQDKLDKNDTRLNDMLDRAKEEYVRYKAAQMESGSGSIAVGGNSNFKQSSKGMIMPLQYSNVRVSAGWYGYPGHKGIDFVTNGPTGNTYGKEIRAAADGKVYSSEYHYSWGNNVYINHGNGVYTRYAHCSRLLVSAGQTVKQGQVIALVGNTGNVYPRPTNANPHAGAHLHFEVWVNGTRVNPAPWLP